MSTVTCHTPECGNADIPLDVVLTYVDENGETVTVGGVVCGVCSQPITDIQGTERENDE